tara:strand:+ start:56 stop:298 length:243 start_codon:yes stop_codon:yes gene_type:complete
MVKDIDILKHVLVPQHVKLSEEEKQKVLDEHNVGLSQLPKIKLKDPALKDMGVEAGDMIKIIRKSPTNLETIFYRVVTGD